MCERVLKERPAENVVVEAGKTGVLEVARSFDGTAMACDVAC